MALILEYDRIVGLGGLGGLDGLSFIPWTGHQTFIMSTGFRLTYSQ